MIALEQWLADATRGLSTESAAQVRAEIQEHYESACEAGDDAIAALGNPGTANRAYRKVLLTEQEAMLVPSFTQPKRPRISRILLTSALLAIVAFFFSRKQQDPGFWPLAIAIFCNIPLAWFFPQTTFERCRIYTWILGVRGILIVSVAWWYDGWTMAVPLGAVILLLDYFFHYQRLSIFRKLASGQTWSPLPEEPRLTHLEAITLRTLAKRDPHENVMGAVLVLMAAAMAVWQPAAFGPMAVFVAVAHITRQTIPFRTEEGSRWFRIAKWAAMVIAALLPVLYGSRIPWIGGAFLAWLFWLFDWRSISIRRKLPVSQWPKKLYW